MGEGRGIYSVAMFQKEGHDFCRVFLFELRPHEVAESFKTKNAQQK